MSKIKVLFFAANPIGMTQLQLDEEIREITRKIRASEYRDSLEIIPQLAARPDDLLQAFLEHKPQIVHFSGHGSESNEIMLLANNGNPKPVTKDALVYLFRTLRDNVRVVFLNACHTKGQADAISEVIDCTIGSFVMHIAIKVWQTRGIELNTRAKGKRNDSSAKRTPASRQ